MGSQSRDWNCIPYVARQTRNHWTTRDVLVNSFKLQQIQQVQQKESKGLTGHSRRRDGWYQLSLVVTISFQNFCDMHMEEKLIIQLMAIFKSSCALCSKSLQSHLTLATLWTVAHQAPLYRAHPSLTFPPAGDGWLPFTTWGFKTPWGSRDQGGIPHCLRKESCQKKDQPWENRNSPHSRHRESVESPVF